MMLKARDQRDGEAGGAPVGTTLEVLDLFITPRRGANLCGPENRVTLTTVVAPPCAGALIIVTSTSSHNGKVERQYRPSLRTPALERRLGTILRRRFSRTFAGDRMAAWRLDPCALARSPITMHYHHGAGRKFSITTVKLGG
ncbi:hypothetical protein LAD77_02050 [Klebsiella pneumoniae]|nr:hypothetical protein [Klebsiella pneumoniae]